jgi:hypothetical protein
MTAAVIAAVAFVLVSCSSRVADFPPIIKTRLARPRITKATSTHINAGAHTLICERRDRESVSAASQTIPVLLRRENCTLMSELLCKIFAVMCL